jgi:hypothetical protein
LFSLRAGTAAHRCEHREAAGAGYETDRMKTSDFGRSEKKPESGSADGQIKPAKSICVLPLAIVIEASV